MTKDERIAELEREVERLNILVSGFERNFVNELNENDKIVKEFAEQKALFEMYRSMAKAVRHEICEKIRNAIKQLIESKDHSLVSWEYANGWCSALQYDMAKILNQIEQVEE